MKKILFSAIAAFCMLSASAQAPALSFGALKANPGETVPAKIYLTNAINANSFAFTAYLPKGFSVVLDEGSYVDGVSGQVCDRVTAGKVTALVGGLVPQTSGTWKDYNRLRITIAMATSTLTPGTGAIYSVNLVVDPSVEPGVYPIYMVGNKATDSKNGAAGFSGKNYTSYIVVGNPTDGALAVKGILPDFIDEDLAKETAIKTIDLTGLTGVDGTFSYMAGRDVVAPTAVTAKVNYVAPAPAPAKYATLCLPAEANVDCWVLDRKEGNTAIFRESTVAPANTPVIIENAVETTAASATLTAVAKKNITSGTYLVGEELHTVKTSATIPALRGYWEESALSNCRIAFETPTGLQFINADDINANAYDLQGRQTTNAKNGVFVINGKKQFVK